MLKRRTGFIKISRQSSKHYEMYDDVKLAPIMERVLQDNSMIKCPCDFLYKLRLLIEDAVEEVISRSLSESHKLSYFKVQTDLKPIIEKTILMEKQSNGKYIPKIQHNRLGGTSVKVFYVRSSKPHECRLSIACLKASRLRKDYT